MKKGLTLIELLVTISVFSIAITAFLELFSSAFKYQQKNLVSAYLLNTASYTTEYITRALRMAKKELNDPPSCLSLRGLNYEITHGGEGIRFLNSDEECQEFFLENQTIKVAKNAQVLPLTPSNLIVERLKFEVAGDDQWDSKQPKVTFVLKLTSSKDPSQSLNLQTTVSQRDLDVPK